MDIKYRLKKIYTALYDRYGSQNWWPGDSELECIIGAILTQNTSWTNVEKAINKLKSQNLISIKKLHDIPTKNLALLIKSSGYYNQKARKIKKFVNFLNTEYEGNLDDLLAEDIQNLRTRLLSINGIGPETADSILLYVAKKPIFVVDTYTHRILYRHNLITEDTGYIGIQEMFMDSLPEDAVMFNEYHALIVKVAKDHCTKKNPMCSGCPLEFDPHTV